MYNIKIQLPSRGKYGSNNVNLRRPKLYDIMDYLQTGDNSIMSKNALIKELCDTDLSNYPVGDREFVFVTLRSLIRDSLVTGTFACEGKDCKDIVAYVLNLKDCKVNQLPEDFIPNYELEFPIGKIKKKLNVLLVKKEELLEEYVRYYETSDEKLLHSDLGDNLYEIARYACLFEDTIDIQSLDSNITFLRELDWVDFEILMAYDIAFPCGPEVSAKAECNTCKMKYRVQVKTDSSFFGLSIENLVRKHTFLAKMSGIGFKDFVEYTVPVMNAVVETEIASVKEHNEKLKAARSKRK